jgi:hypothetical protein
MLHHTVHHADCFKSTGDSEVSLLSVRQSEAVESEGVLIANLCFVRVDHTERDTEHLMENDGLFDLDDTHIIVNDTKSNEELNILNPLFQFTQEPDGTDSLHLYPESPENEDEFPLDSNKVDILPHDIEITGKEKECRSRRPQRNQEL